MLKANHKIVSIALLIISMVSVGSIAIGNTIAPGGISDDLDPTGPGT